MTRQSVKRSLTSRYGVGLSEVSFQLYGSAGLPTDLQRRASLFRRARPAAGPAGGPLADPPFYESRLLLCLGTDVNHLDHTQAAIC